MFLIHKRLDLRNTPKITVIFVLHQYYKLSRREVAKANGFKNQLRNNCNFCDT
jgi:hypothetical protein